MAMNAVKTFITPLFLEPKSCFLFYFNRSFYVHSEDQKQHFTNSSAKKPKVQANRIKLHTVLLVWNTLHLKFLDYLTLLLLDWNWGYSLKQIHLSLKYLFHFTLSAYSLHCEQYRCKMKHLQKRNETWHDVVVRLWAKL